MFGFGLLFAAVDLTKAACAVALTPVALAVDVVDVFTGGEVVKGKGSATLNTIGAAFSSVGDAASNLKEFCPSK